jgi:hypothetical protein
VPCVLGPFHAFDHLTGPLPVRPILRIHASRVREVLPLDLHILQFLSCCRALVPDALDVVDCQDSQTEPISLIPDSKLQGCIDVAFLFVTSNMHQFLSGSTVRQAMDEPRI